LNTTADSGCVSSLQTLAGGRRDAAAPQVGRLELGVFPATRRP
jgi:hypothetical protein